jgi:hypothetical protein
MLRLAGLSLRWLGLQVIDQRRRTSELADRVDDAGGVF